MIPIIANLIIAFAVLGIFYLVYLKRQDPSIVDVAFTVSLILMSISSYILIDDKTASTHLFLFMSFIWGARLAVLLIARYMKGQTDLRYDILKASFASQQKEKFLQFFFLQAVIAFVLSMNFVVAYNYQREITNVQVFSFILFLVALGLEILADYQMFQYRTLHHGKPGVLKEGLWKYSRHPNYFFEVLVWCSFALFASSGIHAIFSWISVAILTYFVLKITGIPATEELLLKTKGEAYRHYQNTTSAFFPWMRKK